MITRESLKQQGEAMRQRLFGDDDGAPAFMRTLNTEASYGAIWSRPGLSMRDRRLLLLGLLTGQGLQDVADIQIGAALRSGELSPDELREIAIFLTHYAGWPTGARLSMQVEKLVGEHARAGRRDPEPDS